MKGLLLLSGGFDSPVAGYLLRDKMELEAIHFSNNLFAGQEPEQKSKELLEIIGVKKLHVQDLSEELLEISKKCGKYYFVIMKRLFYRRAETVAKERGCDFLITGESLGQVSSQTMENLVAIDPVTSLPVLRPVIGWDKQEIIDFSKKIGTHDTSIGKEHCDALGPKQVATKARLERILREEAKLSFL